MATVSRWRQIAERVIAETLAGLPAGLSAKERRKACSERYPFGERKHHPYRQWCLELNRLVPDEPVRVGVLAKEMKALAAREELLDSLPVPKATGDQVLDGLLVAYRRNPTEDMRRLVVADRLEELGHGLVGDVRRAQPMTVAVAQRLWPKCEVEFRSHSGFGGEGCELFLNFRGGKIMPFRQLARMVEGRTLLCHPDVTDAISVERCVVVLRLFS